MDAASLRASRKALAAALMTGAICGAICGTGCGAPLQQGEIEIVAGATERALLALRFGYAGIATFAPPATAKVIASPTEVDFAAPARATSGDVVLLSDKLGAVVGGHGLRRGQLLALFPQASRVSALPPLAIAIDGVRVKFDSVSHGVDAPTGAAWVSASGTALHETGHVSVTTRYDVAPNVPGVLVHTLVEATREIVAPIHIADIVGNHGADPTKEGTACDVVWHSARYGAAPAMQLGSVEAESSEHARPRDGVAHATRPAASYLLVALEAPSAVVPGGCRAGVTVAPGEGGTIVEATRFLALLPRPDALAAAVVQARAVGQGVGEIELRAVDARGLPVMLPSGTRLSLRGPGAPMPLAAHLERALRAGETLVLEVPSGRHRLRVLTGPGEVPARATEVEVRTGQRTTARVRSR